MQPEKILHSQDVSDPARRRLLTNFVEQLKPPRLSYDVDLRLNRFLQTKISRRIALASGIAAATTYVFPRVYGSVIEAMRMPDDLILQDLSEIDSNSVAFGSSPHNNSLEEMLSLNEQIGYDAPTTNLFHTWDISGRNWRDQKVGRPHVAPKVTNDELFHTAKTFVDHDVLTIITTGPGETGSDHRFRLLDLVEGDPGLVAYVRDFAQRCKDLEEMVIVRLFIEGNGNWLSYGNNGLNTSRDYIAAWKKTVDIFRKEGADNVLFFWCPNSTINPINTAPIDTYYPGPEYVDIVGANVFDRHQTELISILDGHLTFNFDGYFVQPDVSPLANFGKDIVFLQKTEKPKVLGEFGSMRRNQARTVYEETIAELAIRAGFKQLLWFFWNKTGQGILERNWMPRKDQGMIEMLNRMTHAPYAYQKPKRNNREQLLYQLFAA